MGILTIGVDVGGTNSDAVVLDEGGQVLSWAKETTSADVTSGVKAVVGKALEGIRGGGRRGDVRRVCIGTTHFLNAVLQKRHLARVSVVRLCGAASTDLPPFVDVTADLSAAVRGDAFLVSGGYYVDGKEFEPLSEEEILGVGRRVAASGVRNVVVSGVYSNVNPDQEIRAARLLAEAFPGVSVTLSHKIGHMGMLERENAALLNECLKPLCRKTLRGFRDAVRDLGLGDRCPIFLTQNDGTLASISTCLSYPVCTFASGPTNSMRGAAYLSKMKNAIVADIGGTSTDVGQIVNGFPRKAAAKVEIGGVYTNFRMPELYSVALGGGSRVSIPPGGAGKIKVGPLSVGCDLLKEAQCVGGSVLTATDVAVKTGRLGNLGDAARVKVREEEARRALRTIKGIVETAVDRVKISAADVPLIVVGGGGVLLSQTDKMSGVSQLVFPSHYQVANAVGAALAQVSGTFDQVICDTPRSEAVETAVAQAVRAAVDAGAVKDTVEVVEREEIPLSYLPGNAIRYSVKAVGNLDPNVGTKAMQDSLDDLKDMDGGENAAEQEETKEEGEVATSSGGRPEFRRPPYSDGDCWELDLYDVEALSVGAGLLGCGGGGSPYLAKLRARECLRQGRRLRIYRVGSLPEGVDKVNPVCFMGAPTVMIEKLFNGKEAKGAVEHFDSITRSKATALFSPEIGGSNGIEPLVLAGQLDLPVVDADGMGRAFPELQMYTPAIYGLDPTPAVLVDERDHAVAVLTADSPKHLEDIARCHVINFMGCSAAIAFNAVPVPDVASKCVLGSYSRAWEVGHAVLSAAKEKKSTVEAILDISEGSKCIVVGKIVDVARATLGGFARGSLLVEPFDDDDDVGDDGSAGVIAHGAAVTKEVVKIDFQNENLLATTEGGGVLATTPDLIVIMETESGLPVQTEDLRYGLRVSVVLLPAPDLLKTEEAIRVVGPRAFGYDMDYISCSSVTD